MTQTAQRHSPTVRVSRPSPRPATPDGDSGIADNAAGGTLHRSVLMTNKSAGGRDLAGTLSRAGIAVVGEAAAAGDALGLTARFRPDTLLVHVGKDTDPEALSITGELGLPLVVLADSADPELVRQAIEAGAMGFVVAPFTSERLLPTLELAAARNADVASLRATVTDITERLDTRKIVERAKGLLMAHEKLTEQDAFRFIQRTAMDRRSSMRDVANAITVRLAGAA